MALRIRREEPRDFPSVDNLLRMAFETDAEAKLVAELRGDADAFVPKLSLVAELEDVIVGYVLFTRLKTEPELRAVALAPVAVLPPLQKKGIGSQLLREAMDRVLGQGFQIAVVLGDPAFYRRFGFSTELGKRVKCPYSGEYLAVAELERDVLEKVASIQVEYAEAFGKLG